MPEVPATKAPVSPVPASTILLLRDGARALEVFMVERHHKIDFAEGALVFPGGKTEESDGDPALLAHCRSNADSPLDRLSDAERAVRVGGIRETFEECGVLLARPHGEEGLLDANRLARIAARYREPLHEQSVTMLELLEAESLELALDRLVPFAHWITPEFMPKRFDTYFFLVAAPTDQLALHDGSESVDSLWTTVPHALELEENGHRTILFPTLENIKKLGRSSSVGAALDRARREEIVPVLPRLEQDEQGQRFMVLPEAAGYETVRAPIGAKAGGRMPRGAPSQ